MRGSKKKFAMSGTEWILNTFYWVCNMNLQENLMEYEFRHKMNEWCTLDRKLTQKYCAGAVEIRSWGKVDSNVMSQREDSWNRKNLYSNKAKESDNIR